ncbi:MAG: NADP-dependent isocitrate dehydrogenase [Fuerstiella sp.]|nr:NADP-dependent isocitrate dehydrogenase [Fuerstiella sp.]
MSASTAKIIYTLTDEAPALATASLLPIIRAYTSTSGIDVELKDISLAGRIIAAFPDNLKEEQRQADALEQLGALVKQPGANVIKLPNISASIPQLTAAISELQDDGYNLPDFPSHPQSDTERAVRARYAKVLGSAVNPVLREGNSDRRVAEPVKNHAQAHPHSMGAWSRDSNSHVSCMDQGDFFGSEQSCVFADNGSVKILHTDPAGNVTELRDQLRLEAGEVIDASFMSRQLLREFLAAAIKDAKEQNVLFSLHLKATMMKVSDPIIFGHAVSVFYEDLFEKHGATLNELGFKPANGVGNLLSRLETLPEDQKAAILADIDAVYEERPQMAMVNSDKGITNLHVPSDVIIDASMPAAIRTSGRMWGPDGELRDTKFVIPDRCYVGVYEEVINFCREHGAFDVATMGNVSNVGLMAQKAEEYGSHDKTFEIAAAGTVQVVDEAGKTLMKHSVEAGDIWRMCQTKEAPIRDWVRLAVSRARATGATTVFWLNPDRAHDRNLIVMVQKYLKDHETSGLDIRILSPVEATRLSCERAKAGLDTISVTGNVLRDYLTDLFPILELGTSSRMLSIVPLLAGGGLFETGAGGSAPKHVQQFNAEGHLRWDSLGEFLALAVSLEDLAHKTDNAKLAVVAKALDTATDKFLKNNRSPSRKVHELDTRGSHFYLALYWAEALAEQRDHSELQQEFKPLAESLSNNEQAIVDELNAVQGVPQDIGGYYSPDRELVQRAMRPSTTLNAALDALLPTEQPA